METNNQPTFFDILTDIETATVSLSEIPSLLDLFEEVLCNSVIDVHTDSNTAAIYKQRFGIILDFLHLIQRETSRSEKEIRESISLAYKSSKTATVTAK